MYIDIIISRFTQNPKQLLIIDAIGAFITLGLVALIAKYFGTFFGIPFDYFAILAVIALLIFIYSSTCFLTVKEITWQLLLSLAIINFIYCFLILTLIIHLKSEIKPLGLLYFLLEILILLLLIGIEYLVSMKIRKNQL